MEAPSASPCYDDALEDRGIQSRRANKAWNGRARCAQACQHYLACLILLKDVLCGLLCLVHNFPSDSAPEVGGKFSSCGTLLLYKCPLHRCGPSQGGQSYNVYRPTAAPALPCSSHRRSWSWPNSRSHKQNKLNGCRWI